MCPPKVLNWIIDEMVKSKMPDHVCLTVDDDNFDENDRDAQSWKNRLKIHHTLCPKLVKY